MTAKHKTYVVGYLMIAPVTLGLVWLYVIPFINNIIYSFSKIKDFGRGFTLTGLKNYAFILQNKELWHSLSNTIQYAIIVILFGVSLSIVIAAVLNRVIKLKSFYRTVYFLPYITMPTVIALIFGLIFNQEFGILNTVITTLGGQKIPWLTHPLFAKISIGFILIWRTIGYNIIFFLSGMQTIPQNYYEASEIDGANPIIQFFRITVPLLTPTIFFVIVIQLINIFQVFDIVFLLFSEESPIYDSVSTVGTFYFNLAFIANNKGAAAAVSIVLFVFIFIMTIFQFWFQKKWVNYDLV